MIFKHLVDKYNIVFAYGPSKIRKSIHTSAVNFVIVILTILQVCLLFFSILRLGLKKPLTIYSIVLLCITALVFLLHAAFHWFKDFTPIEYKVCIKTIVKFCHWLYLPILTAAFLLSIPNRSILSHFPQKSCLIYFLYKKDLLPF